MTAERRRKDDSILSEILDKLEGVTRERCSGHAELVSGVQKVTNIGTLVAGHHKTLYGDDGRGGIVNDTVINKQGVKANGEDIESMGKWIRWGLPILIGLGNGLFLFILALIFKVKFGGG